MVERYHSDCNCWSGSHSPFSLPPSASEPDPEPPDVMEGQTKFIPLMEVCGRGEREGEGGGEVLAGERGKGRGRGGFGGGERGGRGGGRVVAGMRGKGG